MVEVIMPKMGDAMEEGTLVEWLKEEGEQVKSGDVIGSIQTDKATVELTAPGSGTLAGVLLKEGETVPVGRPIAAILIEGEKLPQGWGSDGAPGREKQAEAKTEDADPRTPLPLGEVGERSEPGEGVAPVVRRKATEDREAAEPREAKTEEAEPKRRKATEDREAAEPREAEAEPRQERPPSGKPEGGRILVSPLARRLAEEAGVPLESILGTGPNGRIVERDVRLAMEGKRAPAAGAVRPLGELKDELVPLGVLRRITAERTTQAKQQVPHYYVTVETDVEALSALREQMNAEAPDTKLSFNDFVVKACALALQEQPHINASYEDGKMHKHGAINIGLAIAVPDGLTVAVLKNCERKGIRQLAAETRELVQKAHGNRLKPDELTGSTFSISNMGMYEVENFAAIINQPNGAIVAVSTARRVPVAVKNEEGEELQIRTRMKLTGSFDHRVIDGAVGAEFMGVVRKYLESPTLLLS